MRKIMTILFTAFAALSLTACSGNNGNTSSGSVNSENTNSSGTGLIAESTAPENSSDGTDISDSSRTVSDNVSSAPEDSDGTNILLAYFSATNTTEGVANIIADCLNADLYEITPEQPYTADDLDYHNDKSRSTIEMNDPDARPAISDSVENMEQYDIVFIGYPIWWGEAPRILCTFVESYDFSGKTIVPFCTSGGSGVGSSSTNLEKLTSGATWLSGTRLNGSASKDLVAEWINGLELNITAE